MTFVGNDAPWPDAIFSTRYSSRRPSTVSSPPIAVGERSGPCWTEWGFCSGSEGADHETRSEDVFRNILHRRAGPHVGQMTPWVASTTKSARHRGDA